MSLLARRLQFTTADVGGGGGGGGSDYETEVLADSPLAFYLLDEASGSTAADSSGNSRDATIAGTPDFQQTGPAGLTHALGLNTPSGTDEWVDVPDLSALGTVGFEVWVSDDVALTPSMTLQRLARLGLSGSGDDEPIYLGPATGSFANEVITVAPRDSGGAAVPVAYDDSSGNIATGWHHLVFQWDGFWQIWLDGEPILNATDGTQENVPWNEIELGNSAASTANPFRGLMAAAAFYGGVLSTARIFAHYYAGIDTAEPTPDTWATEVAADTPTMWLRLGESSGTTANDEQNNHDGTYSGVTLGATGLVDDADTAAEWDTNTDYLELSDHADFEADTFTFECWLKHDGPTGDDLWVVADKTGLSSSNNQWAVYYDNRSSQGSPRRLNFLINGLSARWSGTDVSDALTAGGHLVCTTDGKIGRIWWNGDLVASGEVTTQGTNSLPLRVGQQANGTSFGWDGVIDEVVFYSGSVLAAERIWQHHAAGSA